MKQKLLFLIPNLCHGGAEKVLVNLGDGFYAGPFEVKYSSMNDTLFIIITLIHFIINYIFII